VQIIHYANIKLVLIVSNSSFRSVNSLK